jgi:hypothetical protein
MPSWRSRARRISHELIDADGEAHDAVLRGLGELLRERDAEHQGHVGDLDPAVGEVGRERGLRGARDAHEHEVGLLEVARLLAVVALDGEFHGLDAAEVLLRERKRDARAPEGLRVEEATRACPAARR